MKVKDCIGCGYCCTKVPCFLSIIEMDKKGIVYEGGKCPFLKWSEDDNRYWCDLVLTGEISEGAIYVGFGCCSSLNDWRKNVVFRG